MKKAIVTLSVILLTAMSAFADGGDQTIRYYAQKPTQGWFIDLAGTYSIMASSGCSYWKMSTYYGGLNSNPAIRQQQFGFSAKLGRRVNPDLAVRVGYDRHLASNMRGNNFMFKSLHFDVMASPFDMFLGYEPDRFYTMWIYGGVGLLAWDRTTPQRPYNFLIHWRSNLDLGFHGGIMNNFRLSNSFDFHIDLTAVATRWSFDAKTIGPGSLWHRAHFDFSGMAGIMWYIGGRRLEQVVHEEKEETPVVVVDCSAQDRRIQELLDDLAKCQAKNNAVQPCDTVKVEIPGESCPFSIFFNKGSYELRDSRDLQNIKDFAKAAKDNGYKIVLRGTADNATGSAAYNQTLSERRCEKVRDELVKAGVPASNITIKADGGVKELSPAELDRRVFIHFTK